MGRNASSHISVQVSHYIAGRYQKALKKGSIKYLATGISTGTTPVRTSEEAFQSEADQMHYHGP